MHCEKNRNIFSYKKDTNVALKGKRAAAKSDVFKDPKKPCRILRGLNIHVYLKWFVAGIKDFDGLGSYKTTN